MRVDRERRWLRGLFGSALLAAGVPAAALEACSDQNTAIPLPARADGSSRDGSSEADATADLDAAGLDADGGIVDGDGSCLPLLTTLDAKVPDGGPDADYLCDLWLPCGLPPEYTTADCEVVFQAPDGGPVLDSSFGCTVPESSCGADRTGEYTIVCPCDMFGGTGRRPPGLHRARVRARDLVGAYLANLAYEEAASVVAFEQLGDELARHHAPQELVLAAVASRADEVRHARTLTRLAQGHGAHPLRVRRRRARTPPDLETIARHNAREGCVRETYGALLAHFQAEHAEDPVLGRAFARIAVDETRHAALAWAIARWAERCLDDRGRARVAGARRRAVRALARELSVDPPRDLARWAGLPTASAARALLRALEPAMDRVDPRDLSLSTRR